MEDSPQLQAVSGIAYYMSPPHNIKEVLLDPIHTLIYIAFITSACAIFSKTWIEVSGSGPRDIAKQLNAGDEYIELDRQDPEPQWEQLKKDNPYGFDVVVEATGVEKLAQESINYVRRGGTIMIYGVYENKAQVHWPPAKIFGDEIKVRYCHR